MTKTLSAHVPHGDRPATGGLAPRRAIQASDYHRQLLDALSPVVAALTAAVRGYGKTAQGQDIKSLPGRLAAIPSTLAIIARWADEFDPERLT